MKAEMTDLSKQLKTIQDANLKEAAKPAVKEPHVQDHAANSQTTPSTAGAKAQTALEHFDNCPECHKNILEKAKKELEPLILKDFSQTHREKVKSMTKPVICKDCGEIVEGNTPECPNCKGTEPRKFQY